MYIVQVTAPNAIEAAMTSTSTARVTSAADCGTEWEVARRYSEFVALRKTLSDVKSMIRTPFPGKFALVKLTHERAAALHDWLVAVVNCPAAWRSSALSEFLGFDDSSREAVSVFTLGRHTSSSAGSSAGDRHGSAAGASADQLAEALATIARRLRYPAKKFEVEYDSGAAGVESRPSGRLGGVSPASLRAGLSDAKLHALLSSVLHSPEAAQEVMDALSCADARAAGAAHGAAAEPWLNLSPSTLPAAMSAHARHASSASMFLPVTPMGSMTLHQPPMSTRASARTLRRRNTASKVGSPSEAQRSVTLAMTSQDQRRRRHRATATAAELRAWRKSFATRINSMRLHVHSSKHSSPSQSRAKAAESMLYERQEQDLLIPPVDIESRILAALERSEARRNRIFGTHTQGKTGGGHRRRRRHRSSSNSSSGASAASSCTSVPGLYDVPQLSKALHRAAYSVPTGPSAGAVPAGEPGQALSRDDTKSDDSADEAGPDAGAGDSAGAADAARVDRQQTPFEAMVTRTVRCLDWPQMLSTSALLRTLLCSNCCGSAFAAAQLPAEQLYCAALHLHPHPRPAPSVRAAEHPMLRLMGSWSSTWACTLSQARRQEEAAMALPVTVLLEFLVNALSYQVVAAQSASHSAFPQQLLGLLRNGMADLLVQGHVVGSTASGVALPGSDIDVTLLVPDSAGMSDDSMLMVVMSCLGSFLPRSASHASSVAMQLRSAADAAAASLTSVCPMVQEGGQLASAELNDRVHPEADLPLPRMVLDTLKIINAGRVRHIEAGLPPAQVQQMLSPAAQPTAKELLRQLSNEPGKFAGAARVDISMNQGASVVCSALVHAMDVAVGQEHLFKRSLVFIKAWLQWEAPLVASSAAVARGIAHVHAPLLGAATGGFSSYAIFVLVAAMFNTCVEQPKSPLGALALFCRLYTDVAWPLYGVSLFTGVRHLYEDAAVTPGSPAPQKDRSPDSPQRCGPRYMTPLQVAPLIQAAALLVSPPSAGARRTAVTRRGGSSDMEHDSAGRPVAATKFMSEGEPSGAASKRTGSEDRRCLSAHLGVPYGVGNCNIVDPLLAWNNLAASVTEGCIEGLTLALSAGKELFATLCESEQGADPEHLAWLRWSELCPQASACMGTPAGPASWVLKYNDQLSCATEPEGKSAAERQAAAGLLKAAFVCPAHSQQPSLLLAAPALPLLATADALLCRRGALSSAPIVALSCAALHESGPQCLGEVGKLVQAVLGAARVKSWARQHAGGLKPLTTSMPLALVLEDSHAYNPKVSLAGPRGAEGPN